MLLHVLGRFRYPPTTEVTPRCTGWFAAGAVVVRLTVRLPVDPAAEKKEFSSWLRDTFSPVED